MTGLQFATCLSPVAPDEVRLLAASLGAFGGRYSGAELQAYDPRHQPPGDADHTGDISKSIPVQVPPAFRDFPFAAKVFCAAQAEARAAQAGVPLLVWLDGDTLILQPPQLFDLPPGLDLACRPVHHRLIGPAWGQPLDGFWREVYRVCSVPEERLFCMLTHVEEDPILPYFNAGLLVVRPEAGLLRTWAEAFQRHALAAPFQAFYQRDARYRVFIHQALLAGALLNRLRANQIRVLPADYNYPLHLHHQVPPERQPSRLDDLVTARYDGWQPQPGWRASLPAGPALARWLEDDWLAGSPQSTL
ncbi:MAG: hypothetical protein HPY76_09805 [Anaerolineae bacterium]|nr:hypothetical protein [Anaerolineae bacterium]